ncbi:MAG TPA: O-antigen ligase family protein [Gaiellaceae bacterium]|jgi:O-antigen ligase|nr:O-antigen ligase family protein [Gaiellaceae bacterium]
MRAIRELPIAASLLLVGLALFFGGGPGSGSLPWLGGGALLAILVLIVTGGLPDGWQRLVPLAALAAWLALSISWSALPDHSWTYANRTFVYLLFALLGLWLARHTCRLALGLMALFGAVLVWSLLGKVLPVVYDYGPPEAGRLRGPIGLWNQLALVAAFALPLALWRRRLEGILLAYVAIVALLLTYSRGGVITAVLVLAAWLVLDDERLESAQALLAAAVPAAAVVGIAFALPGVTGDNQSLHVRWRDGLIFGVLLVAGAVAATLLRRVPLPRVPRRVVIGVGVVVIVALVAVVVAKGGGSGAIGNGGGRLTDTSSNFRFTWWGQAVKGWEHNKLLGTGAGTFHVTNVRYRGSFLDYTTEPHNVPLQFLSEAGIVGLALFLVAVAALVGGAHRRRKHELALAVLLPAYLVHSLVDIDWDFVAVSAPAFLAAGAVLGRAELRRVSAFGSALAAGAALLLFGALLMPWLGERWSNEALVAGSPSQKISLAKKARSVDPLLVEPLWWQADAQTDPQRAVALYQAAVDKQPKNPQTWLYAGLYGVTINCPRLAYYYLERFTELDPQDRPSTGGDAYRKARAQVNTGKPKC